MELIQQKQKAIFLAIARKKSMLFCRQIVKKNKKQCYVLIFEKELPQSKSVLFGVGRKEE